MASAKALLNSCAKAMKTVEITHMRVIPEIRSLVVDSFAFFACFFSRESKSLGLNVCRMFSRQKATLTYNAMITDDAKQQYLT